jgi:hypothetical protein
MIKVSDALSWLTTLEERKNELTGLRRDSSMRAIIHRQDKEAVEEKPMYDIKNVDKMINAISMQIRKIK